MSSYHDHIWKATSLLRFRESHDLANRFEPVWAFTLRLWELHGYKYGPTPASSELLRRVGFPSSDCDERSLLSLPVEALPPLPSEHALEAQAGRLDFPPFQVQSPAASGRQPDLPDVEQRYHIPNPTLIYRSPCFGIAVRESAVTPTGVSSFCLLFQVEEGKQRYRAAWNFIN